MKRAAILLLLLALPLLAQERTTLIRNATILTITNGPIENGSLLIRGTKIAAVGARTAHALEHAGIRADVVASGTIDGVGNELGPGEGRVLFPRVEDGPLEAVAALERHGWQAAPVAVYRNVPGEPRADALARIQGGDVDVITLTSASTAQNLSKVVGATEAAIVCIGSSTAEAARAQGYEVAAVADTPDTPGLVRAVVSVAASGTIAR